MIKFTRRTLARYAVKHLLAGKPASAVAKELAAVISDSKQAIELDFLLGDIAWELENSGELAVGHVTSAHEINEEVRAELEQQLKQATGVKQVLLETEQDKSLIAGLRVETAKKVWDFSVARRLAQLKEMF